MIVPNDQYNQSSFSKSELTECLRDKMSPEELNNVLSAYEMAQTVHQFQKRNDGTPYFWHVTRVTKILVSELSITDPDMVIAALLHDALEDSDVLTPEVLEYNFGPYVRFLVEVLTKDLLTRNSPLAEEINRKYVARLASSPEDCKIIKLCDRLDNSRCLQFHLKHNPYKYIQDTIDNYLALVKTSTKPPFIYLTTEIRNAQSRYLA